MEKLYVTMAKSNDRVKYFPQETIDFLRTLGEVTVNEDTGSMTEEDLIRKAPDATVLVTHWGCPQITEKYLNANPNLKIIAHCAGTVAHTASEESYRRVIPCLSANDIMALYVAEGVLGHLITGTHCYKQMDLDMHQGIWNRKQPAVSLLDCTVGVVGLGAVARHLLNLLTPFNTKVLVYDPFLKEDSLKKWPFARRATLNEVMGCDAVTLHAAQTPETFHMIGKEQFDLMKDDALFINTARGSLVDTQAAIDVLKTGRIRAIFDVYEKEGCAQEGLMGLPNVTLQPHAVALPAGVSMTWGVLKDIETILKGGKGQYEVSFQTWSRMTQE